MVVMSSSSPPGVDSTDLLIDLSEPALQAPAAAVALRRPHDLPVVTVDGVGVHAVTEHDAATHIAERAEVGEGGLVVTPNLDHLRLLGHDRRLADAYAAATLRLPDGRPVLWAARAGGHRLPARVAGASLLWSLSGAAAARALPIALLGGTPGSGEDTALRLRHKHPALRVSAVASPWVDLPATGAQIDELSELISATRTRIAFLAFGCPKQELLGAELVRRNPTVWFLGVGGAFEMAAGRERRAPEAVQRMGMEWAFRMVQDPRRLARRYLAEDLPYLPGVLWRARRQAQLRRVAAAQAVSAPRAMVDGSATLVSAQPPDPIPRSA